jgi:hypothetical protein
MAQLLTTNKTQRALHGHVNGQRLEVAPDSRLAYGGRFYRAIAYIAVCLPLVFLMVCARLRPDFNRGDLPDWKLVYELAESKRAQGDETEAKGLYSRAGRLAGWQDDWPGLLAADCGLYKIDRDFSPYSGSRVFLLRAMVAAEERQSRAGMKAVARAFTALGAHEAASMVRARVGTDWPEKPDAVAVYNDCG